jgi:hypothetical protein
MIAACSEARRPLARRMSRNDGWVQARYCAFGAVVSRRLYAGQDHFGLLDAASSDVLQWMSARFAGSGAAPDDCPA